MIQHPFHIFDCLRALNNIMFPSVRDFSVYDKVLHINEITVGRYAKLGRNTKEALWLEVLRPEFTHFPQMPEELAAWIGDWGGQLPAQPPRPRRYYRNKEELWEEKQSALLSQENSSLKGERFDAVPARVKDWRQWLRAEWTPWAKENQEKFEAIEGYEKIWSLAQILKNHKDRFELLWCTAILCWRLDGLEIRRPLLTSRLEIEHDPHKGLLRLLPTKTGPKLEYDMLFGLPDVNFPELFLLERQLLEEELDLRDNAAVRDFSQKIADAVAPGCQVLTGESLQQKAPTGLPRIYCADPALVLRKLDASKWRGELEGVVETIDAGGSLSDIFGHYYRMDRRAEELPERGWKESSQTPLFPWAAADAQWEAIRRLPDNNLVVVEAPEGSGKEQLVGNLLSHLLAHGKKVLVTGPCGARLQQAGNLINKEFSEIAPLCVCAAGTEKENINELFTSLRAHNQKMNFFTREQVARALAELQTRLGQCRNELLENKNQLQAAQTLEYTRKFSLEGKERSPWEVAAWLVDKAEKLGYIPDAIGHDQDCPLNGGELGKFFELLRSSSPDDGKRLNMWWLFPDQIMAGERLEDILQQLEALYEDRKVRQELLADCLFEEADAVTASGVLAEYQQALTSLPGVAGDWLENVLKDLAGSSQRRRIWEELYQSSIGRLQKIRSLQTMISDYTVTVPERGDFRHLRDVLYNLRIEFFKNGKLGFIYKLTAGKKSLGVFEECLINGQQAASIQDVDLILAHIDYLDEVRKLAHRWNNTVFEIDGPQLDDSSPLLLDSVERYVGQLKKALHWQRTYLDILKKSWQVFSHNQAPQWSDRCWLGFMLPKLQAWSRERYMLQLLAELERQKELLTATPEGEEDHPVCATLLSALEEGDIAAWQDARAMAEELTRQREAWQDFRSLYVKMADIAPLWVEKLLKSAQQPFSALPEDWPEAWQWSRGKSWLSKHREGNRLMEMHGRYMEKQKEESVLVREVAASSAWYWQLKRITAEEKKGLDFLLGKADQKYGADKEDELPRDFLREAEFWRMSLPAWIMPIDVLLQTLGPFDRLFDVVIVEESEKCDIFNLCLLLRGRKAVIIGDNMLPGGINMLQGRAAAKIVLEKSLLGLPAKVRFDLNDSIYDFALRLLDGQSILLNEIYNYLPGLSGFVNEHFYGGKLTQLMPGEGSAQLLPVLNKVVLPAHLAGTNNRQEASGVVNKLAEVIKKPEYAGKSLCILTLGGSDQVELLNELLLQRVAEEEIAARDITVSSVCDYAGGRRDVVFFSLVSAQLAEKADMRDLNAAVSTVREQMYVFRPFAEENIFVRSLSARLLALGAGEQEVDTPEAPRLVQDVWRAISGKGYRATAWSEPPGIGRRLDIVIESSGGKAAVICDGLRNTAETEKLFKIKEQLARAGWHTIHIRGCDFYIDRENTLGKLWQFLEKVGIMTTQEENTLKSF